MLRLQHNDNNKANFGFGNGVMVIVRENGHGDTSSNPEPG